MIALSFWSKAHALITGFSEGSDESQLCQLLLGCFLFLSVFWNILEHQYTHGWKSNRLPSGSCVACVFLASFSSISTGISGFVNWTSHLFDHSFII